VHDESILFHVDGAEENTPAAERMEDIAHWEKATGKGGIKRAAEHIVRHHRDAVTYKPYASKKEVTPEAAEAKLIEALRKYISNGKKAAAGQPFRAASIPHVQFCTPADGE
jgi:hypothetical protein